MSIGESFGTRGRFHLVGFVDSPNSNVGGHLFVPSTPSVCMRPSTIRSVTRIPTAVYAHGHAASGTRIPVSGILSLFRDSIEPARTARVSGTVSGSNSTPHPNIPASAPRSVLHELPCYIRSLQTIMRACPSWRLPSPFCMGVVNWEKGLQKMTGNPQSNIFFEGNNPPPKEKKKPKSSRPWPSYEGE